MLPLLLLTKHPGFYNACVHEHKCALHLLYFNLLCCRKIVSPPPESQLLIWSLIIMLQQER